MSTKAIGVVRKLDELGRVVLPVELRRVYDLKVGDGLEIFVDSGSIVLRKYEPACVFCGEAGALTEHQGKKVCDRCRHAIALVPVPA